MAKATHTGTCQCCGAHQKLPNGVLSKHGYTVENGWFNGVCYGAGELPFEQSKDLIEGLIERAAARAVSLRAEAEEYLNNPSNEGIMHHVYVRSSSFGMGKYVWQEDKVLTEMKKFSSSYTTMVAWWESGGEHHPNNSIEVSYSEGTDRNDPAVYIRKARQSWYNNLIKMAEQAEQYVVWQQGRIKNWAPAELTPIK